MKIKGKTYWFSPQYRSTFSTEDNPKYVVEITNLDDATVQRLTDVGARVKQGEGTKEEWGSYVSAKSKFPIRVIDTQKNLVSKEQQYGNGTGIIASVELIPLSKQWQKEDMKVSLGARTVMITTLVEYVSTKTSSKYDDEFDAEDIEGGFVAESVESSSDSSIDDDDLDDLEL